MRAWEVLKEYDPNISDKGLKKLIITRVRIETDRKLLDRLFQAMEKSNLDDRLANVLSKDVDAKQFLQKLTTKILLVDGSFQEKNQFIDDYPKGFIDTKKMLTPNVIHSFGDIIIGSDFVLIVADAMMLEKEQGIGSGEYAFALLSPKIKAAGHAADIAGDLLIDGTQVEVKAKVKSPGRFYDGRKAGVDIEGIKRILDDMGVNTPKGISLGGLIIISQQIEKKERKKFLKDLFLKIFRHYKKVDPIIKAILAGDEVLANKTYLMASFHNYKQMSGFDGVLLLDTKKKQMLYFTNADDVYDLLFPGVAYINKSMQEFFSKVEFRI